MDSTGPDTILPFCLVKSETLFFTNKDFCDVFADDLSDLDHDITTKRDFFPKDPVMPSRYSKTKSLYVNGKFESDDGGITDPEVGKWLIYSNHVNVCEARGMTEHDFRWQFMRKLVENYQNTGIFAAKCSTAWLGKKQKRIGSPNGVICCYTADYSDKFEVKRAADSIRDMIYYPHNLYYKTNVSTKARRYRYLGHKMVCRYMHTSGYEMFERDGNNPRQWNAVIT